MTARVDMYDLDQMLSSCPIFTITISLSMKPTWTQNATNRKGLNFTLSLTQKCWREINRMIGTTSTFTRGS